MLICDELDSFLDTIKDLPSIKIVDAAASERRVKDSVQKLEDLINSHLSDQLILLSDQSAEPNSSIDDEASFTLLLSQHLPKVKDELSSFLAATLLKITDDKDQQQQEICRYSSSSDYTSVGNQQQNLLVGLDDQIKRLNKWIWNPLPRLSITSVVGMTGIGKTTLVKQVYCDPRVVEKFETRLFVHIGPHCNLMEDIMLVVLNQLGVVIPSVKLALHKNKDYVKHQLSKALSSKKYLIVLDDVWISTDLWLQLESSGFPDNRKGSRVIIIFQIQSRFYLPNLILLTLVKDDDSWKLLHQTAHSTSEEECSRELEKIGKKIARNCEGLPAAIIQVGENLRGKSFQEWKTLSEKEDPLDITRYDDTPLSKGLYLSYMMLPQYLKLCFMYMGVFPKNYGIYRSKLIKLWLCEGFLSTYGSISNAEQTVGGYLDLLICHNVVLREKHTSLDIQRTKQCRLHFTFRILCVNEANSEEFFHIIKSTQIVLQRT